MTTVVVQLPPALARDFARIADDVSMSHDDLARLGLRLFVKAVKAGERTNQPTNQRKTQAAVVAGWVAAMTGLRSVLVRGSDAVRGAIVRDIAVEKFSVVDHRRAIVIFRRHGLRAGASR